MSYHASEFAFGAIKHALAFMNKADLPRVKAMVNERYVELAEADLKASKLPPLTINEKAYIEDGRMVDAIVMYRHRTERAHSLKECKELAELYRNSL